MGIPSWRGDQNGFPLQVRVQATRRLSLLAPFRVDASVPLGVAVAFPGLLGSAFLRIALEALRLPAARRLLGHAILLLVQSSRVSRLGSTAAPLYGGFR